MYQWLKMGRIRFSMDLQMPSMNDPEKELSFPVYIAQKANPAIRMTTVHRRRSDFFMV